MTATELLVTVAGLVAGYWLVSKWLSRNEGPRAAPDRPAPPAAPDQPGMTPPWHHVLELAPDASVDEIRAAYLTLIDQARGEQTRADEITGAYERAMRLRNEAPQR